MRSPFYNPHLEAFAIALLSTPPTKGEKGGECQRPGCACKAALYHHKTTAYYCTGCLPPANHAERWTAAAPRYR